MNIYSFAMSFVSEYDQPCHRNRFRWFLFFFHRFLFLSMSNVNKTYDYPSKSNDEGSGDDLISLSCLVWYNNESLIIFHSTETKTKRKRRIYTQTHTYRYVNEIFSSSQTFLAFLCPDSSVFLDDEVEKYIRAYTHASFFRFTLSLRIVTRIEAKTNGKILRVISNGTFLQLQSCYV